MKQPIAIDKTTLAIVRNWLIVAQQSPQKLAGVLQRARADLDGWLPALIVLSTSSHGPANVSAIKLLGALAGEREPTDTLLEIYSFLPRKSSALAEVAAQVTEILMSRFSSDAESNDGAHVMMWNNRSERSHDDNRPMVALRCAETAVELCRSLTSADAVPRRIQTTCLLTLAKRLAENGKTKRALAVAKLAWGLATIPPHSGDIKDRKLEAQAAINYANRLAGVGEVESAEIVVERAIKILSEFPDSLELRYDLAMAELALANQLTNQGRHEDSLPHADNAERLFRVLTGDEPDEYFEYAAAAANTFAQNLTHTGNLELAYNLSCRSVERMDEYVRRQPARFGQEFTAYLISAADCAGDIGRYDEAISFARRAVVQAEKVGALLYRRDWYLEGTAHSNLFNLCYRLEDFDEAEKAIRAACRAFKRLPRNHPESRPGLARSLRGLAEVLRTKAAPGQGHRAVRVAREAVRITQSWRGSRNESLVQLASHCRTTLALCLEESGRLNEAIAEERKSLKMRRDLFGRSKKVYRSDLAYSLSVQAKRLLNAGEPEEALELAVEAVRHYEQVFRTEPERIGVFMANAVCTLAEIQIEKSKQRGIKTLVRGIKLLRPRFEVAPDVWGRRLLPLCIRYVECCSEAGIDFDESLVVDVIAKCRRQLAPA